MVYNLVDKVMYLSHPSYHKKNFDYIYSSLMKNNYPLAFIKNNVKKRIFKIRNLASISDNSQRDSNHCAVSRYRIVFCLS